MPINIHMASPSVLMIVDNEDMMILGDDGVELPRVWPAENVIYQLVPPPPTPAELKFTAKLALHLEETRRQNLLDIRQSPSSADFPNTTNTLYDYEKSSGHPNPATKEKKNDNPSKKEFNNEDSKTINVAAETTSTPFTTTHRDITLVSTPVSATNMTTLASSDSLGDINKRLAEALLKTTTTVTNPCTKLLKQGGRYCKRISDGDKKVCLDEILSTATKRPNGSCLVYSFGVGHDFSFDMAMSLLGCEVFAFDDDEYHSIYPVQPFPRVHFSQTRLGSFVLYQEVDNRIEDSIYTFLYRPLDNIMYILGHTEVTLHLLKVDIEGAEWDIFSKSIFELSE
ncbi:hypothetical protein Pmani_002280 [Petrolisthes manimaculis]|uniref:Methyltransferase domain-containing protein n=1 Tax=Petrolisthes manimaculis TaxID=1843537 RepID=A0AAE1QKL5_9EUCA|nr:hypothetical protein Pmani_002280 [Petrolisthes manimaculis]